MAPLAAQATADPEVTPTVRNVTRVESWSFFEPLGPETEPDYTLLGNRATLGMRVAFEQFTVRGSFQYAQLVGLPRRAFGPGPLGPGALFFAAAENTRAFQLYFKSMSVRVNKLVPGLSLEVGRMPYESGEGTPFAGRLIGNAEWTMFERAFDGVRVDYEAPTWRAHGAFVMPTQGAYEESASPTIGTVRLASARWARNGIDVFAHNYRDTRAIRSRPDNTGIPAPRVDVSIQTLGASMSYARGAADAQVWGALQRGQWYGDDHRALSGSVEAGHRWPRLAGQPSVRGGVRYASGDEDPNDTQHGTFFPMVPTTTPGVLAGTYAQMNLRDLYVRGSLDPHDRLSLSAELHRLSLASRLDRWYSGTGATAFSGTYFGYSSRPSTLRSDLGTFLQISAVSPLTRHWRLAATVALVRGGQIVRRQFARDTLRVVTIESRLAFP